MIAFSIGSIDIYRYGIFYVIAFLVGYLFLLRVSKKNIFWKAFPRLQTFLEKNLDDLMLCIFLGVLVWWRLGHVIIYDFSYYLQHPSEIFQVWKWGMSFIWGMIGVTISLGILAWKKHLKRKELLLLGDMIFAILPFGIMLGRIGNFLNQELYGITAAEVLGKFGYIASSVFHQLGLYHIYPQVDTMLRVNTNILSSFFEGLVLLIITLFFVRKRKKTKTPQPGKIVAVFLLWYSFIRFLLEYLRADSQLEFHGRFTISQWFFIGFFLLGVVVLIWRKKLKAVL
jgi:phosphatidylglycerol---prolipoprotein diacylglyceryl transferase